MTSSAWLVCGFRAPLTNRRVTRYDSRPSLPPPDFTSHPINLPASRTASNPWSEAFPFDTLTRRWNNLLLHSQSRCIKHSGDVSMAGLHEAVWRRGSMLQPRGKKPKLFVERSNLFRRRSANCSAVTFGFLLRSDLSPAWFDHERPKKKRLTLN